MKKVFIIAEAGVNHNGDISLARRMIDIAAEACADAIKFQTFKAEQVISRFAPKADYQKKTTARAQSQLDMVRPFEFNLAQHRILADYCKKRGILFLSAPFDLGSVDLLNTLGLNIFKIPSGEITSLPLLRKIGNLKKKVILSTGMADCAEIAAALRVLVGSGTAKRNITLLHCNTEYPTPYADVNLLAMQTIGRKFGVTVGYSDHTPGIEVPLAAVALGARVIEKHFTLDKNMPGPDQQASLDPLELKAMVASIRNVEVALGCPIKKASPSEIKNKVIARKSIIAARNIRKGEMLTVDNITFKRPGSGISPMRWDRVIGTKAKRDFNEDELIHI